MPRPGFYNDNEYRAYPFVFSAGEPRLPESTIVDAGFIMRLDAGFDDRAHTIWLASITRAGSTFTFEFRTDANTAALLFTRNAAAKEWQIEYGESAILPPTAGTVCTDASEPIWEGFIVTGPLADLDSIMPADGTRTFAKNEQQIEPGRIQNLKKAYLRAISVGNYERPYIPLCGSPAGEASNPDIIINKTCMQGDIRLKEGYNCVIRQPSWTNELRIGASRGAGAPVDQELCANGSELALFENEPLFDPPGGKPPKFFVNGPACDDLIFTLNGLGGPSITITGGTGVNIATQTNPPKITIARNLNSTGNCENAQA